jgi:predicted Zn finger-like uncharacterized protein
MKFVCDRCQTRYSIADEKVRQKILRIRCKTCGNVVVVQGERVVAGNDAPAAAPIAPRAIPGASRSTAFAPVSIPAPKPAAPSAPKAIPAPAGRSLPLSAAARPAAPPTPKPPSVPAYKAGSWGPPPPPSADLADVLGGRAEWYLAVGGVRSGPFTRVEASGKILATDPGKVVHVWKEGMNGWKAAEEVSVIARELSLLRSPPPPPPMNESVESPALKTPPPVAKPARMTTSEPAFPGKPLHPLADGTTERMSVDAGSDSGPFREITTKKGAELQAVSEEAGSFSDITTKKAKSIRKLIHESEASSFGNAAPIVPSSKSASFPALIPTPLPLAKPASFSGASTAAAAAPANVELDGFDGVMSAVAEPGAVEPEVYPDGSASLAPSLAVAPAETEKTRPGMKYLLAAGIIVIVVLLIALVSFRMDSHKVPVEPQLPQSKAAAEPTVAIEEPKPTDLEPQAALPVVDEKPVPGRRGGGKRSAAKTVKQVVPARMPAPSSTSSERPVPKLSGRSGVDSHPNPFDESRMVSQSQISAVVRNKANQAALKACYERALKMDNHLTSGRIDVTVSVGMSGIVEHVVVNAPSSFILVEPCIKTAVRRWVFPPSSEEYATNFPLILQGGM